MDVVLAGASGLIGSGLRHTLAERGDTVRRLVRRAPSSPDEVEWHPERGELDPGVLASADVVVGLSGAGIGDRRWDGDYKQLLRTSRTGPTGLLARTVAGLRADGHGPATFVSASAVGYYGDTGDRMVTEDDGPGRGFLADLCREWEDATAPAAAAGVRVATLRTGLVLSPDGGLMGRLAPLARFGLAGRLGNGRQYWPWISLADEIAGIVHVIDHAEVAGPVNLTGPRPVTNREFAAATSRVLHRPQPFPVPGAALTVALGEFAREGVLAGQRAVPGRLADSGYVFAHPDVDSALHYAFGR